LRTWLSTRRRLRLLTTQFYQFKKTEIQDVVIIENIGAYFLIRKKRTTIFKIWQMKCSVFLRKVKEKRSFADNSIGRISVG